MDTNRENYYNTLQGLLSHQQQFSPGYGNYQYVQSQVQNYSPYSPGLSIVRSQTIVRHRFTSSISNHPSAWKMNYTPPHGGYMYMAYPQQLYYSPHLVSCDQQEMEIPLAVNSNQFTDISMIHQDYSHNNVVAQDAQILPFISPEFKACLPFSSKDHNSNTPLHDKPERSLSQHEVISEDQNDKRKDNATKSKDDVPSHFQSIPSYEIKNQFLDSKAVQNSVLLQHALNYIAKEKTSNNMDIKNKSTENDIRNATQSEHCLKENVQNQSPPQSKECTETSNLCLQQDVENVLDLSCNKNENSNNEFLPTKVSIEGESDFCSIMQSLPILPDDGKAENVKTSYSKLLQSIAEKVGDGNVNMSSKRQVLNDDLKINNNDVCEKVRKSIKKKLEIGKNPRENKKSTTNIELEKSEIIDNPSNSVMCCKNKNRIVSSELVSKSKRKIHKSEGMKDSSSSKTSGSKTKSSERKYQVKKGLEEQNEKRKQTLYKNIEDPNECSTEKYVIESQPKSITRSFKKTPSKFVSCDSTGNPYTCSKDTLKHQNDRSLNKEKKKVGQATSNKAKLSVNDHRTDINDVHSVDRKSTCDMSVTLLDGVVDRSSKVLDMNTCMEVNSNIDDTEKRQIMEECSENGTSISDKSLDLSIATEPVVREYMIPCLGEMYVVTVDKDGKVKSEKKRKKVNKNIKKRSEDTGINLCPVEKSLMNKSHSYQQQMSGLDILSEVASCISEANCEENRFTYKTDKKLCHNIDSEASKDTKTKNKTGTRNIIPRKATSKSESTKNEKSKLRQTTAKSESTKNEKSKLRQTTAKNKRKESERSKLVQATAKNESTNSEKSKPRKATAKNESTKSETSKTRKISTTKEINKSEKVNLGKEKTRKEGPVKSSVATENSKNKNFIRKPLVDHNYAKHDKNTLNLKDQIQITDREKDETDQDLPKLISRSRQKKSDLLNHGSDKNGSFSRTNIGKTTIKSHRQNPLQQPFIEVNQNVPFEKSSVLEQFPMFSTCQSISNSKNQEKGLPLPRMRVPTMPVSSAVTKTVQSSKELADKTFRVPLKEMCTNVSETHGTFSQRKNLKLQKEHRTLNFFSQQSQENVSSAAVSDLILQHSERNLLSLSNVLPEQSAGKILKTSDCLSKKMGANISSKSDFMPYSSSSKFLFHSPEVNAMKAPSSLTQQLTTNLSTASTNSQSWQSLSTMSVTSTIPTWTSEADKIMLKTSDFQSQPSEQLTANLIKVPNTNIQSQQSSVNMEVDRELDPYSYRNYPRDVVAYEDLSLFSNGSHLCKSSTYNTDKILPLVEPTVKNLNPIPNISDMGVYKKCGSLQNIFLSQNNQDCGQMFYNMMSIPSNERQFTKPYLPVCTSSKPLLSNGNHSMCFNTSELELMDHSSSNMSTDMNKKILKKTVKEIAKTNDNSNKPFIEPYLYTSVKPFMTSTNSLCTNPIPCVWEKDRFKTCGMKMLDLECCDDTLKKCWIQNEGLDLRIPGLDSGREPSTSFVNNTSVELSNVHDMNIMDSIKTTEMSHENVKDMFPHLSKTARKNKRKRDNKRKRELLSEFNQVCATDFKDESKMPRKEDMITSNLTESNKDQKSLCNTLSVEQHEVINSDVNVGVLADGNVSHNANNNKTMIRQVKEHQKSANDNEKNDALTTRHMLNDPNVTKMVTGCIMEKSENEQDSARTLESKKDCLLELKSLPTNSNIEKDGALDPDCHSLHNGVAKRPDHLPDTEIPSLEYDVLDTDTGEETILYCEESETSTETVDYFNEDNVKTCGLKYGLQPFDFDTGNHSSLNLRNKNIGFVSSPFTIDPELNIDNISPFNDFDDNNLGSELSSHLYTDFDSVLADSDYDLSSKYFGEDDNIPLHSSPIFTKSWHDAPDSCSKFNVDSLLYHPIALPIGYYSDEDESEDNITHKGENSETVSVAPGMQKALKSPHEKTLTFCQWVLYRLDEVKRPCHWQWLTLFEDDILNEKWKAFEDSGIEPSTLHKYLTPIKALRRMKNRKGKSNDEVHVQKTSSSSKSIHDTSEFNKVAQKRATIISDSIPSELEKESYCNAQPETKNTCHMQSKESTRMHNAAKNNSVSDGNKLSECETLKSENERTKNRIEITNTNVTMNKQADNKPVSVSSPTTNEISAELVKSGTMLCEVTGMFVNIEEDSQTIINENLNPNKVMVDFSRKCANESNICISESYQANICKIPESFSDIIINDIKKSAIPPVSNNKALISEPTDCRVNEQCSTVSIATTKQSTGTISEIKIYSKENTECSAAEDCGGSIATTKPLTETTSKVSDVRDSFKEVSVLKETVKSVTEIGTPVLKAVTKFVKDAKMLFAEAKGVKDNRKLVSSERTWSDRETSMLNKGIQVMNKTSFSDEETNISDKGTMLAFIKATLPDKETEMTSQVHDKSLVANRTTLLGSRNRKMDGDLTSNDSAKHGENRERRSDNKDGCPSILTGDNIVQYRPELVADKLKQNDGNCEIQNLRDLVQRARTQLSATLDKLVNESVKSNTSNITLLAPKMLATQSAATNTTTSAESIGTTDKTSESKSEPPVDKSAEAPLLKCKDTKGTPLLVKPMATVTPLMKHLETSGTSRLIKATETIKRSTKSSVTKGITVLVKPLAKVSPVKSPEAKEKSLSTKCLTMDTMQSQSTKCEESSKKISSNSLASGTLVKSTDTQMLANDTPAKYETEGAAPSGVCLATDPLRTPLNESVVSDVSGNTRMLIMDKIDNLSTISDKYIENTGNYGQVSPEISVEVTPSPITEITCRAVSVSGEQVKSELNNMPVLLLTHNMASDAGNNNQCVNTDINLTELLPKEICVTSKQIETLTTDDHREKILKIGTGRDAEKAKHGKMIQVEGNEKVSQAETAGSCKTIDSGDGKQLNCENENVTQLYKDGEYNIETRTQKKRNSLAGLNLLNKLSQEAMEYIGCSIDEKLNQVRPKKLPKYLQCDAVKGKKELLISYRGKGYHRESDNCKEDKTANSFTNGHTIYESQRTNSLSCQTQNDSMQKSTHISSNSQIGELAENIRPTDVEEMSVEIKDKKHSTNTDKDKSKNKCSSSDQKVLNGNNLNGENKRKLKNGENKQKNAKKNCKNTIENEDMRNTNSMQNRNKNTKNIAKKSICNGEVKNKEIATKSEHKHENEKIETSKEICKENENAPESQKKMNDTDVGYGSSGSKDEDISQTVTATDHPMKKRGKKRKNDNIKAVKKSKDQLVIGPEEKKSNGTKLDLVRRKENRSKLSTTENKATEVLKLDLIKIKGPSKETNDIPKQYEEQILNKEQNIDHDLKPDVTMNLKSSSDSDVMKKSKPSHDSDDRHLAHPLDFTTVKTCNTWNISPMRPCKVVLKRTRVSPRRFKDFYMAKSIRMCREKQDMTLKTRKVLPSKLKYIARKIDVEKSESKFIRTKENASQNVVTKATTGNVRFRIITDRAEQVKIKRNKKLMCKFCKQRIAKCNLMTHTQTQHQWRCVACTKVFDSKEDRKLHFSEFHTGDELHTCMICRVNFHYLKTMERHRKSHVHIQLARLQTDIIGMIRGCLGKFNMSSISNHIGHQAQGSLSGRSFLPLTEGETPPLDINENNQVRTILPAINSSEEIEQRKSEECNNQILVSKKAMDVVNNTDSKTNSGTKNPTDTLMVLLQQKLSNGKEVTIKNFLYYEPGLREVIQDLEFCLGSAQQSRLHGLVADNMPSVPFDSVETIIDQINVFHNMSTSTGPPYLQANLPAGSGTPYLQSNIGFLDSLSHSRCPPAISSVPFNQSESSRNNINGMICLPSEEYKKTENKMSSADDLSSLNLLQTADLDMVPYDINETNLSTINTSDLDLQQENFSGLGPLLSTTEKVLTSEMNCTMKSSDKGPSSCEWLTRNLQDIEEDTLIPDFLLSPLKGLENVDSNCKGQRLQYDQIEDDMSSTQTVLLDISGNTKGDNLVQPPQDFLFSYEDGNKSSSSNLQHTYNADVVNDIGNTNLEELPPSNSEDHENTEMDDLHTTTMSMIQQEYDQISKDIEKDVLSYCDLIDN